MLNASSGENVECPRAIEAEVNVSLPVNSTDLKGRVVHCLNVEMRPALQASGADIEVLDVNDGVVRVRLQGGCSGCPSALMAVIMEVEQELRKRIPEVEYLEAVPGGE
jgi:Fe-S cluster biogenesis protein NfuA